MLTAYSSTEANAFFLCFTRAYEAYRLLAIRALEAGAVSDADLFEIEREAIAFIDGLAPEKLGHADVGEARKLAAVELRKAFSEARAHRRRDGVREPE